MGMMARIAFVLAVLTALPTHADPRLRRTCTWIHDLKAAGISGDGMLEACGINGGPPVMNTLYDLPRKDSLGACTIRLQYITLKRDATGHYVRPDDDPLIEGGPSVEILPPPAPDQCPSPREGGYLLAGKTPEGVFLELLRLWRGIKAAPSQLDALSEHVPARNRNWIDSLKNDLTTRELDITAVDAMVEAHGPRAAAYQMIVRYADDFDDWYEIEWDWDGGRFVIVDIALAAD